MRGRGLSGRWKLPVDTSLCFLIYDSRFFLGWAGVNEIDATTSVVHQISPLLSVNDELADI